MIDVQVHLQGVGVEPRKFGAVPEIGSMIDAQGQLWRIAYLIYGATVDVFAVRLADSLAADMRAQWAGWDAAGEGKE
jgi:hypothetical protein